MFGILRTSVVLIVSVASTFAFAAGGFSGRVVDKEGKPVAGAPVVGYFVQSEKGRGNRPLGKVTTAADGSFSIPAPDPELATDPEQIGQLPPQIGIIAQHPQHGLAFVTLKLDQPRGPEARLCRAQHPEGDGEG